MSEDPESYAAREAAFKKQQAKYQENLAARSAQCAADNETAPEEHWAPVRWCRDKAIRYRALALATRRAQRHEGSS